MKTMMMCCWLMLVMHLINSEVFLHNISYICPAIYVLLKTYSSPLRLFIIGRKELKSNEGTTEGDPVAMAICGIGVTPLIKMLINTAVTSTESQVRVLAYADDFSAAGKLEDLRKWWDTLTIIGLKFGYYLEPTETWLLVKPYASQRANKIFSETKIKINNEGHKYLGGTVSTVEFKDTYMEEKAMEWINQLEVLSKIAAVERQAAYCAFVGCF